jgi:virginiamycin A acetyltransferase
MGGHYTNNQRRTVIELGENVFLSSDAKITVPRFTVGDHTRVNGPILVRGREECSIGKYCALGYHITIVTTNHDISRPNLQINLHRKFGFCSLEISKGPVAIGHNVWIGDNVTILSGVNIGSGSVVGAGAVVTDDLPPCSVAAGVPARLIKYRFNENIIGQFLELKWWDWSEERIKRNKVFFESDLARFEGKALKDLVVE